jgi:glycosyltransferase involved in cell wall biosynthesis
VDDGSTDQTNEILKGYKSKIRYFRKKNGGVSTALNLGISEAKGEYISWLSHDDIYVEDKISIQVEILREIVLEKRLNTILYSNYAVVDFKGEYLSTSIKIERFAEKKLNDPFFPLVHGLINGCTLLIPKNAFNENSMFDERLKYTQDYALWFKIFPKFNIRFHKDITLKSRSHSGQGTKNVTPQAELEYDKLWIDMISNITADQMRFMSGSILKFYKEVLSITYEANYLGAALFIEAKIDELESSRRYLIKTKALKVLNTVFRFVPGYGKLIHLESQQKHTNAKIRYMFKHLNELKQNIVKSNQNILKKLEEIEDSVV